MATLLLVAGSFAGRYVSLVSGAAPLDEQLSHENPAELIAAARRQGDAQRGAVLFHERNLGCATCHLPDNGRPGIGPDLTRPAPDVTDAYLLESLLDPSKRIRKGYESVQVITDDGRTIVGLLAEETTDELVLRSPSGSFELQHIAKQAIDDRVVTSVSLMPTGLVNQLVGREQFVDLLRYLLEISEFGPQRVAQLRPPRGLFSSPPLPEYESHLDHARLLREADDAVFRRGEAIYQRVCANCHGTHDRAGSLPSSLRFASGRFKNGADPYSIYRTLTYGFGLMAPQTWMVPREKYDVIHYLREAYLKPNNPTQYTAIDDAYIVALPKGDTLGPEPSTQQPWVAMDYGPSLINTYEIGSDGSNFAYKGIAVRLDSGPGGVSHGRNWMIFDHDTLRVAAVWSKADDKQPGFIDYNGIHFNGRHQVHPRIVGNVWLANRGLGWANPATGGFDDVRLRGRDDKPYGPLPRTWGRFKGIYHHNGEVVFSYSVGDTEILEMPSVASIGDSEPFVFSRGFSIGPRSTDLILAVAEHPSEHARLRVASHAFVEADESQPAAEPTGKFDGKTSLDVANPGDFDLAGGDYTILARIRTKQGGTIFCQTSTGDEWVPGGKAFFVRGGRLCFDIGWVGVVESQRKVDDGQWHEVAVTYQHDKGEVRLFIDHRPERQGTLAPGERLKKPVVRIGFGAPDFPQPRSYFNGQMSDVRFYRRALSQPELARPWQPGKDKALLACWRLDEGVSDIVENRHDATVVGSPVPSAAHAVIEAGLAPRIEDAQWTLVDRQLRLRIPASDKPLQFTLWTSVGSSRVIAKNSDLRPVDFHDATQGGATLWRQSLATPAAIGNDDGPFAIDVLTHPADNPWSCQMRFTGFDFLDNGRAAAIGTWDGDVWLVRGVDRPEYGLSWQRIACGLFQPLGLKVVDGKIYVGCRDQIVVLHDLNGDDETDFYENFNSDHQVTEHFHEFAMGLQTDAEGNFYYAKSARHALPAVVPHHGTLLRVSRDGLRTDILATGFRAANGVCLNPDGTFFVTDQEGHWTPKNRINCVEPGGFYGNMFGYHNVTDTSNAAMRQPLCWITNSFDRSPGELLWVTSDAWGKLKGSLLELSYGAGKVFIVPHEKVGGQMQGGMCALPMPIFPTGVMRGRFHPTNGQLYVCGMFAWAGNQTSPGGFYRVRCTGKPVYVPIGLHTRRDGIEITFSGPLAEEIASDPGRYTVRTWSLRRTQSYGSAHYNERERKVASAMVSPDKSSVVLELPDQEPTWCMSIHYRLRAADGTPVVGEIDNTIHVLH